MTLYLVSRSTTAVVSLEQMKLHLRVDTDDDDDLILAIEQAAVEHIDGPDGSLQRAIVDQTWDLKLCGFSWYIEVPLPPLISIESVKYYDADGVLQTADDETYEAVNIGSKSPGRIILKSGSSWPAVYTQSEPVIVRFRAGYMDTGQSPAEPNVPKPIIAAIKLMAGTLYAHRETVVIGQTAVEVPFAAEWLLQSYKVYA